MPARAPLRTPGIPYESGMDDCRIGADGGSTLRRRLATRPGVSIHSRTQLQNYKELEVKWRYESEVHKIRTFADLRNRANRQRLDTCPSATVRYRSASPRYALAWRRFILE